MKTIVLSRAAEKEVAVLPGAAAADIADALHVYAFTGQGNVKHCKDGPATDFASAATACYSSRTARR
jgi:hypothetical protein